MEPQRPQPDEIGASFDGLVLEGAQGLLDSAAKGLRLTPFADAGPRLLAERLRSHLAMRRTDLQSSNGLKRLEGRVVREVAADLLIEALNGNVDSVRTTLREAARSVVRGHLSPAEALDIEAEGWNLLHNTIDNFRNGRHSYKEGNVNEHAFPVHESWSRWLASWGRKAGHEFNDNARERRTRPVLPDEIPSPDTAFRDVQWSMFLDKVRVGRAILGQGLDEVPLWASPDLAARRWNGRTVQHAERVAQGTLGVLAEVTALGQDRPGDGQRRFGSVAEFLFAQAVDRVELSAKQIDRVRADVAFAVAAVLEQVEPGLRSADQLGPEGRALGKVFQEFCSLQLVWMCKHVLVEGAADTLESERTFAIAEWTDDLLIDLEEWRTHPNWKATAYMALHATHGLQHGRGDAVRPLRSWADHRVTAPGIADGGRRAAKLLSEVLWRVDDLLSLPSRTTFSRTTAYDGDLT
jgi:hypothetical protein